MLSRRLLSPPTGWGAKSNSAFAFKADLGHASGRAFTEVILLVTLLSFVWLMCALLISHFRFPNQIADAESFDSLKTIRSIVPLNEGQILTVHRNGELHVWDEHTRTEIGELINPQTEACCGSFAPHRQLLAVGSTGGQVTIWDFSQEVESTVSISHVESLCAMLFAPDERFLITGNGNGKITLWNTTTWTQERVLTPTIPDKAVQCLELSHDGKYLFVGDVAGSISKWRLQDGVLERTWLVPSPTLIGSRTISTFLIPNSSHVAILNRDGVPSIWNHETGQLVNTLDNPLSFSISCTISSDRATIYAVNEFAETRAWNLQTGEVLPAPKSTMDSLRQVTMARSGTHLIGTDDLGALEFIPLKE